MHDILLLFGPIHGTLFGFALLLAFLGYQNTMLLVWDVEREFSNVYASEDSDISGRRSHPTSRIWPYRSKWVHVSPQYRANHT